MRDSTFHPDQDRLQAYVEDTLDVADRAILASHLLVCAECRAEVAEWRSLFNVLATLPQFEPSAGFAQRVMAHVPLPDPWYVRTAARARAQLQVITPKTTRAWGLAAASVVLPLALLGSLVVWICTRPYVTPQSVLAFGAQRVGSVVNTAAASIVSNLLQSSV